MPELPEVETTRRGLQAGMTGQTVHALAVRQPQLRWPVPESLAGHLPGRIIGSLRRRGKYLLVDFDDGSLILHLGMSGSLRLIPGGTPPGPHDHVDLILGSGQMLRLTDPRRFGAMLWQAGDAFLHPLLRDLGPEPLDSSFDGLHLKTQALHRRVAVKSFIMDGHVVVGVGNIYASESLFRAGIHPERSAGRISLERWSRLAEAIRQTLSEAIEAGGSTLRNFVGAQGQAGHFQTRTQVYGRTGEPCRRCGHRIRQVRTGQRSTFFCPQCQR